jgi:hypothetical protein
VFPLFAITPGPQCACGNAACTRVGKHPAIAWGELAFGDEVPRPEPGAGYGIKTGAAPKGSGLFVVDLDGEAAIEWWAEQPETDAETYTVETGRGLQLYFDAPGFPVKNSAGELAPGVDIRGDGGFVVGAGSPHRSGKTYTLLADVTPAAAPSWLLEWLRARPAAAPLQDYPGDVTGGPERDHRRKLYAEYLQTTPPCVQGQAGDQRLFEVVQRGAYDLALPTADVLELLHEHFDPRCEPPWGEELAERVRHKAHSAKTASTRPRAEPLPADVTEMLELGSSLVPPDTPRPRTARGPVGIVWGSWEAPVDPPQYLVHGLVPIETVGMFVAMGSSLKTWTALDIGLAVAHGRPWLGRFATRSGRVLVIDYESGLYELRRRVHLLKGAGVGPDFGAWAYPQERIDDVDFWKKLAGETDWGSGGLVIVDSLAAGAPNVDENDARVAMPLKLAARFTEGTGASVLFIHHSRKDDGDDRKMVRGSTAIYADCDWAYKFENIEETRKYRRMHMVNIKPSMGPKPEPVHLELTDENGLIWFDESDAAKAKGKDATPEEVQRAILLALESAGAVGIPTKAAIAKACGLRGEKTNPQVDVLMVRKEIANVEGKGYLADSPAARVRRVVETIDDCDVFRSEAELGRAAGVTTSDVKRLVLGGVISRSAEGRFLVLKRA